MCIHQAFKKNSGLLESLVVSNSWAKVKFTNVRIISWRYVDSYICETLSICLPSIPFSPAPSNPNEPQEKS